MKTLYIAWQDPKSRSWTPVGKLTREDDAYRFVYTKGAEQFSNFRPFGRMNDLHTAYVSNELFPLFSNRILSKSRPEYREYLQWLGLNESNYDELDELSRTGGLRTTDSVELIPCPNKTHDARYEVFFFTRGLRHFFPDYQKRAENLSCGDQLFLIQDVQNKFDPSALLLRTNDPMSLIGYVPRYYSGEFSYLLGVNEADAVKVSVVRLNENAPMQYRVLCKLQSPWPSNFMPCSNDEFKVLA